MKMYTRVIVLMLTASLLTACGWHLRGSGQSLELQKNIYLEAATGEVYRNIQRSLTRKKPAVDIVDADIQLVLGDERFDRRSVTVDNSAQTTQYQLTIYVPYQILDSSGKPLIKQSIAEVSRYYTFNQNAINSSDREERSLRKEMVRQLSRQILQRVQFLSKNTL